MKGIISYIQKCIFHFFLLSDLKPCKSYNVDRERFRYKLNITRSSSLKPYVLFSLSRAIVLLLPRTRAIVTLLLLLWTQDAISAPCRDCELQPCAVCCSRGLLVPFLWCCYVSAKIRLLFHKIPVLNTLKLCFSRFLDPLIFSHFFSTLTNSFRLWSPKFSLKNSIEN